MFASYIFRFPAIKSTLSDFQLPALRRRVTRHLTYRDKQVVSYSRVHNIKNISLHKLFASLFQKSITNCPVTRRHIKALRILSATDRIQVETGVLEARMTQKNLKEIF